LTHLQSILLFKDSSTGPLLREEESSQFRLDGNAKSAQFPDSSGTGLIMSRECCITGAKPAKGHVIHRRGMAKKKGGVGRHVTANTPRLFLPNLKTKRIWVPELNRYLTLKLSARALKTIARNGAFQTLKKAGLV
jgi:large subunit ribosomal protein L28